MTQGLHVSLGANFILIFNLFHVSLAASVAYTILYASVKEFIWDMKMETEETSGGFEGGCRDFAFYMVGILAALVVLAIKRKILG